jgi:hypothetical protein
MPRQPTAQQVSYQHRSVQGIDIATDVMHRHSRTISATEWDGGRTEMLPESSAHTLKFRSAPTDVTVSIEPEWFRAPAGCKHDIEAAVEAALAVPARAGEVTGAL